MRCIARTPFIHIVVAAVLVGAAPASALADSRSDSTLVVSARMSPLTRFDSGMDSSSRAFHVGETYVGAVTTFSISAEIDDFYILEFGTGGWFATWHLIQDVFFLAGLRQEILGSDPDTQKDTGWTAGVTLSAGYRSYEFEISEHLPSTRRGVMFKLGLDAVWWFSPRWGVEFAAAPYYNVALTSNAASDDDLPTSVGMGFTVGLSRR